jgi:hypothetical protein
MRSGQGNLVVKVHRADLLDEGKTVGGGMSRVDIVFDYRAYLALGDRVLMHSGI